MNSKRKLRLSFKLAHPNLYIVYRYLRYKLHHIDYRKVLENIAFSMLILWNIFWLLFIVYWGFIRP